MFANHSSLFIFPNENTLFELKSCRILRVRGQIRDVRINRSNTVILKAFRENYKIVHNVLNINFRLALLIII